MSFHLYLNVETAGGDVGANQETNVPFFESLQVVPSLVHRPGSTEHHAAVRVLLAALRFAAVSLAAAET